MPIVEANSVASVLSRLWEHGQSFLWAGVAASFGIFAILFTGSLLGIAPATAMLDSIGVWTVIVGVAFLAFAIARTIQSWPRRSLFFVPREEQCVWGHARQANGDVFTNFNVSMDVTNTSDSDVHISKPRIVWPLRARWREAVTSVLLTRDPQGDTYGQDFPIRRNARSHSSGVIAIRGAVCRPGKRLTFVISVVDHRGKRHRIKFRNVMAANMTDVTKPQAGS